MQVKEAPEAELSTLITFRSSNKQILAGRRKIIKSSIKQTLVYDFRWYGSIQSNHSQEPLYLLHPTSFLLQWWFLVRSMLMHKNIQFRQLLYWHSTGFRNCTVTFNLELNVSWQVVNFPAFSKRHFILWVHLLSVQKVS